MDGPVPSIRRLGLLVQIGDNTDPGTALAGLVSAWAPPTIGPGRRTSSAGLCECPSPLPPALRVGRPKTAQALLCWGPEGGMGRGGGRAVGGLRPVFLAEEQWPPPPLTESECTAAGGNWKVRRPAAGGFGECPASLLRSRPPLSRLFNSMGAGNAIFLLAA